MLVTVFYLGYDTFRLYQGVHDVETSLDYILVDMKFSVFISSSINFVAWNKREIKGSKIISEVNCKFYTRVEF